MGASRKTIREFVAGKLGRKHSVIITSVDGPETTLTIPNVGDIFADNERLEDAYIAILFGATEIEQFRRITAMNVTTGQTVINRAFDTDIDGPQAATIYTMLTPDEWNEAVNEALIKLYFHERVEVTLRTSTLSDPGTEYDLGADPIDAPWIQHKGMIVDVRYRNITTGEEQSVPRLRFDESRNNVKIHLLDKPWDKNTYSMIVEARRFYPRLNQDDWGTTCPTPLWQAAVEVSAIHKMIKKFGSRLKANYAQDLAIAEREEAAMRAAILPVLTAREYQQDEDWFAPDIDSFFLSSGWH